MTDRTLKPIYYAGGLMVMIVWILDHAKSSDLSWADCYTGRISIVS